MNVTSFLKFHPGSQETVLNAAGGDVTQDFYDIGHSDLALSVKSEYELLLSSMPRQVTEKIQYLIWQNFEASLPYIANII